MCEISIVLPVYNGADHLARALDSILQQSFRDFELIIVNDCSVDSTDEIINKYQKLDDRIQVIKNENNLKLPASLNVGFKKATGKYLTWTSHDNLYQPEALQLMYEELEKDDRYGLIYADYSIINEEGEIIRKNPMEEPETIFRDNVVGACFLYRKDIADRVGEYDTGMFLAEDYDYWLRMCQYTRLRHMRQNLYLYRCHEKSLSMTRAAEIRMQTARLWMKHLDFIAANLQHDWERWQFYDSITAYASATERKDIRNHLLRKEPAYGFHIVRKNTGKCVRTLLRRQH